jgi:hypothetical protein
VGWDDEIRSRPLHRPGARVLAGILRPERAASVLAADAQ